MEPTTTAYGTWSGGRFMHFGETLSEARFIGCIQTAYEAGIRTFVTSDVYGNGKADELLGSALRGVDRSTYSLVGMIGHDFYEGQRQGSRGYPRFTDPELRGPEQYADFVRMAASKELERCGCDRFDLLMLHNPDEIGYTSEPLWQAMKLAKDEGLTTRLGIAPGPANGFSLDLIGCFERFGELIRIELGTNQCGLKLPVAYVIVFSSERECLDQLGTSPPIPELELELCLDIAQVLLAVGFSQVHCAQRGDKIGTVFLGHDTGNGAHAAYRHKYQDSQAHREAKSGARAISFLHRTSSLE